MSANAKISDVDPNDNPGVIVRPPLLYLGALVLGFGLDWIWPSQAIPDLVQYVGGATIAAVSFVPAIAAMRRFRKAGTNVPTTLPVTALVVDGPYRYSRNPIYVGLTLLYAGIGVAADNLWALGLLLPVLAVMRYGVIAREERYLEDKFGDAYRRYKARVRRWL